MKICDVLGDINPDSVTSSLSSDGLLSVTAPRKKAIPSGVERKVPITQTGVAAKEVKEENEKKAETSASTPASTPTPTVAEDKV